MLITFEGIDGCGKSTQVKLLHQYFTSNNKKSLICKEPGGTQISNKIREILLSPNYTMSGISEVLLFCASKSINIDDIVLPHLNNGGIIIYDRFNHSTLAYQGYAGGIDLDIINNLCNIATKGLQPDLTFYIDTSLQECKKRRKDRIDDRMELQTDLFFNSAMYGYNVMCDATDTMFRINGNQSVDDIFNDILEIINGRI